MGWQSSRCTMTCFWISWMKQPKRWAQDFVNLSKRHVLLLVLRNCSTSMMHVPVDKLSNLHMWIVRQGAPQMCTILSQLHCMWGKIQRLYLPKNILEKLQTRPQLQFLQNTMWKKNFNATSRLPVPASRGRTSGQWPKMLNINTYKFHSYGDYTRTIWMYGTMDSYSSELVSVWPWVALHAQNNLIFNAGGAQALLIKISVCSHWPQELCKAVDCHQTSTGSYPSYSCHEQIVEPSDKCARSNYHKLRRAPFYREIAKFSCKYCHSFTWKSRGPSY